MTNIISRLKRAKWTFNQSLTKKPEGLSASISDLFVWRNSTEWKTFFELIDIPALFGQDSGDHYVNIVIFDDKGDFLVEDRVDLRTNKRKTICLSELLDSVNQLGNIGEIGTFSVFHSHVPKIIQKANSYIEERGYVSYQYKNNPLRSYVHGNLDAISLYNNNIEMLGGHSFLTRQYNLQYEFTDNSASYEIGLVNASSKSKNIKCKVVSTSDRVTIHERTKIIPSKGVGIFIVNVDQERPVRIIIESRLFMARPMVFSIGRNTLNVFHG